MAPSPYRRTGGYVNLPLSAMTLSIASLGLAAADWAYRRAGDSLWPGGPLDETAHLLTTLLVVWALGRRVGERFCVPALIASVAIDLDHVPGSLGANWITAGTPRPYTHSLLAILVILLVALLWQRRRDLLIGVALGIVIHFWRDLSESGSGVSLLWPFSYHSFSLPHAVYVAAMVAVVVAAGVRCTGVRRATSRSRATARG